MMKWEEPIMEQTAKAISFQDGRLLEIGYGMGIFSKYALKYSPQKYIVSEVHPQVLETIPKTIKIIEGKWQENINLLKKEGPYDSIFFDTACPYEDAEEVNFFFPHINELLSEKGKLSFWFPESPIVLDISKEFKITWQEVKVKPEPNGYFGGELYHLPIVERI